MKNKKKVITIDCTPTWSGVLPILIQSLLKAAHADKDVFAELYRMAKAADKWNAHCNSKGDKKK